MRISDWSSDVCSSDLPAGHEIVDRRARDALRIDPPMAVEAPILDREERLADVRRQFSGVDGLTADRPAPRDRGAVLGEQRDREIGRASCRERVCQYV